MIHRSSTTCPKANARASGFGPEVITLFHTRDSVLIHVSLEAAEMHKPVAVDIIVLELTFTADPTEQIQVFPVVISGHGSAYR